MTVAIVTKYHGPTNYRGSRITASVPSRVADSRRHYHGIDCEPTVSAVDVEHRELYRVGHWTLTMPYDHALSGEALHRTVAQALADRLGWAGVLVGGALDDGYAFTFAPDEARCAACDAPLYGSLRVHHHAEDGKDVTRASR